MIQFHETIVALLNDYFVKSKQYVESVRLSSFGFSIQFVDFDINCEEKVFAKIGGESYEWDDAPNSGPWGAFGRQLAVKAELKSLLLLSITFESGDSIQIETKEHQYESVIFNFPPKEDSIVMEIF